MQAFGKPASSTVSINTELVQHEGGADCDSCGQWSTGGRRGTDVISMREELNTTCLQPVKHKRRAEEGELIRFVSTRVIHLLFLFLAGFLRAHYLPPLDTDIDTDFSSWMNKPFFSSNFR